MNAVTTTHYAAAILSRLTLIDKIKVEIVDTGLLMITSNSKITSQYPAFPEVRAYEVDMANYIMDLLDQHDVPFTTVAPIGHALVIVELF